jgi:hypothetical protein
VFGGFAREHGSGDQVAARQGLAGLSLKAAVVHLDS